LPSVIHSYDVKFYKPLVPLNSKSTLLFSVLKPKNLQCYTICSISQVFFGQNHVNLSRQMHKSDHQLTFKKLVCFRCSILVYIGQSLNQVPSIIYISKRLPHHERSSAIRPEIRPSYSRSWERRELRGRRRRRHRSRRQIGATGCNLRNESDDPTRENSTLGPGLEFDLLRCDQSPKN
jgi:hypothetical protein